MKSESKIQQEIFQWYWNNFCLPSNNHRQIIFHVANEGQHKLTNIGVLAGVSDLICTILGNHFYIEVKDDKGRQLPSQLKFQKHIEAVGHPYYIVRSLKEFQYLVVRQYNKAGKTISSTVKF